MKYLVLFITFLTLSSCTRYIYRGEVTHTDNNNDRIIELYGSNVALKSDNQTIQTPNIVEVTTKKDYTIKSIKIICLNTSNHCDFITQGEHTLLHIREDSRLSTGSSNTELLYKGTKYIPAFAEFNSSSIIEEIWIEEGFSFFDRAGFGVLLLKNDFEEQKINGKYLLLHYDLEHDHSHR